MLDEAHERSLQTDMALGFIKKILRKRTDLRIIISSATLDAKVSLCYLLITLSWLTKSHINKHVIVKLL